MFSRVFGLNLVKSGKIVVRDVSFCSSFVQKPTLKFNTHCFQVRTYKNIPPKNSRRPKTKSAIAKRFIANANGDLKYAHSGKSHLNIKKSRTRLRRLNNKGLLTGTWLKNMNRLIR